VLGWTDDCREITDRQSLAEARRTGTDQRTKLHWPERAALEMDLEERFRWWRTSYIRRCGPKRKNCKDSRRVFPLAGDMGFTSKWQITTLFEIGAQKGLPLESIIGAE
jgi:hypothetical protein